MSATRLLKILQGPHVTEKTSQVEGNYRQYVFKVLPDANKFEIRQAVEKLLNVKVRAVTVCNVRGKAKRFGQHIGKPKSWKKACVTLQENNEIDLTKI